MPSDTGSDTLSVCVEDFCVEQKHMQNGESYNATQMPLLVTIKLFNWNQLLQMLGIKGAMLFLSSNATQKQWFVLIKPYNTNQTIP